MNSKEDAQARIAQARIEELEEEIYLLKAETRLANRNENNCVVEVAKEGSRKELGGEEFLGENKYLKEDVASYKVLVEKLKSKIKSLEGKKEKTVTVSSNRPQGGSDVLHKQIQGLKKELEEEKKERRAERTALKGKFQGEKISLENSLKNLRAQLVLKDELLKAFTERQDKTNDNSSRGKFLLAEQLKEKDEELKKISSQLKKTQQALKSEQKEKQGLFNKNAALAAQLALSLCSPMSSPMSSPMCSPNSGKGMSVKSPLLSPSAIFPKKP